MPPAGLIRRASRIQSSTALEQTTDKVEETTMYQARKRKRKKTKKNPLEHAALLAGIEDAKGAGWVNVIGQTLKLKTRMLEHTKLSPEFRRVPLEAAFGKFFRVCSTRSL